VQVGNLKYLSTVTDLPLVQLLDSIPNGVSAPDCGKTLAEMISDEGLDEIATYAAAIAPGKGAIVPVASGTRLLGEVVPLVERAHARGLQVTPPPLPLSTEKHMLPPDTPLRSCAPTP
jgi:glycerophosphoryl diester phosphodiesterase